MVDVFKGVKVPEEEAKICADVLITADKRGIDSHGIGRLKPFYYDRIRQVSSHQKQILKSLRIVLLPLLLMVIMEWGW